MSCPTESRTLDEYSSAGPKYRNRKSHGSNASNLGVDIYDAVSLQGNDGKGYKVDLEGIIEGSISNGRAMDSAWGCDCDKYCKGDGYYCKYQCDDKSCSHCSKNCNYVDSCPPDCLCDHYGDKDYCDPQCATYCQF
jgi:hypothetical protein